MGERAKPPTEPILLHEQDGCSMFLEGGGAITIEDATGQRTTFTLKAWAAAGMLYRASCAGRVKRPTTDPLRTSHPYTAPPSVSSPYVSSKSLAYTESELLKMLLEDEKKRLVQQLLRDKKE